MGIPASRRSAIVFRRTRHTLGSGGLGFIEPSISWEVVAFSALLELANGVEAQPATVVATMINNVARIIKADFLSGDIGAPVSRLWCAAQQLRAFYCQTCDAVNVGFRAGGLGNGMSVGSRAASGRLPSPAGSSPAADSYDTPSSCFDRIEQLLPITFTV